MRVSRFYLLCVVLLGNILSAAAGSAHSAETAAPAAAAGAGSGANASAQATLKNAVADSQTKLGLTEAWQKKLFDDEVVPQYQRFIRDYRSTASGVQADVDLDMIRKYLAFYATKSVRREDLGMILFLRAERDCGRCIENVGEMRRFMTAKAEHRGFKPLWISGDEVGDSNMSGKALEDRVSEIARDRNAAGAMVVQLRKATIDIDAAHADESRYQVQLMTLARAEHELKFESLLEILSNDTLENAAQRLMTDAFIDFGGKAMLAGEFEEDTRGEILVVVSGIRDFAQFSKLKTAVETGLGDARSVEQRRIGRGQVTFAVHSLKKTPELRAQLAQITVGEPARKLAITGGDDHTILVEAR